MRFSLVVFVGLVGLALSGPCGRGARSLGFGRCAVVVGLLSSGLVVGDVRLGRWAVSVGLWSLD